MNVRRMARPAVALVLLVAVATLASFPCLVGGTAIPPGDVHHLSRNAQDGSREQVHIFIPGAMRSPSPSGILPVGDVTLEPSAEPSLEPDEPDDSPETTDEPHVLIESRDPEVTPEYLYPHHTPLPTDSGPAVVDINTLQSQEPEITAFPSTGEKVVFEVPLLVDFSGSTVPRPLDLSIRKISAERSDTDIEDWKLVEKEALVGDKVGLSVRQIMLLTGVSSEKHRWKLVYHGLLSADQAPMYEKFVNEGGMDTALKQQPDVGQVQVRMSGVPTRVVAAPVAPDSAVPVPPPQNGKSLPKPPTKQRSSGKSSYWQIPLGVCLVASVLVIGAIAFIRHRRKSSFDGAQLGGDETFTRTHSIGTMSEFSSAECRLTSLGPGPRGPDVLRQQAGIMDWQQNAAAAAELEGIVPAVGAFNSGGGSARSGSTSYIESVSEKVDPDEEDEGPESSAQHSFVSFKPGFGGRDSSS